MKYKFILFLFVFLYGCSLDPDLFTDNDSKKNKTNLSKKDDISISLFEEKTIILKEEIVENNFFIWPAIGQIIYKFGPVDEGVHNDGVIIKADYGTIVKPTYKGEIIFIANNLKDFGSLVLIQHPNGLVSSYAHLSKINVEKGLIVSKNDIIGEIGDTGSAKFPQLYFEIRDEDKPINPESLIK